MDTEVKVSELGEGLTLFNCCDYGIRKFERQYTLPSGMTYNSYLFEDEGATVVFDTVDHRVEEQWLETLALRLGDRMPDYLIVHHLEPDHSAGISRFMADYPDCRIVCSVKAAQMLPQFCDAIDASHIIAVSEGDTLAVGSRILTFVMAPMVHWPEVMMTYDNKSKTLFSADAFGTFGCGTYADEWPGEARRYYINICGKYGAQVQTALRKTSGFEIEQICPLHGPVLRGAEVAEAVSLYDIWSSYLPEFPDRTLIAVATLHGNSLIVAESLREMLAARGRDAEVIDLTTVPLSEAVAQAFACGTAVFISSTYDAGLMPAMRDFIGRLISKGFCKRRASIVENGSWAPIAGRLMKAELEKMRDISFVGDTVTVKTRLDDNSAAALQALANQI